MHHLTNLAPAIQHHDDLRADVAHHRRREGDALRCPEELTIPLDDCSRGLVR